VVRIRDEAGADPEYRERFNLEVRSLCGDVTLVDGYHRVVLLVNIQVLHEPVVQKVVKVTHSSRQVLNVSGSDPRLTFVDYYICRESEPKRILMTSP